MKDFNIKKITSCSILSALFVVLNILSVSIFNLKVTFQNLPLFITCFVFGGVEGFLVGFCGMFLAQIITFGFTVTTFLWIMPYAICGYICGKFFGNKKIVKENNIQHYNKFYFNIKLFFVILMFSYFITLFNTLNLYIDSKINGYYNFIIVFGNLFIKLIVATFMALIYSIVIPFLAKMIYKLNINNTY